MNHCSVWPGDCWLSVPVTNLNYTSSFQSDLDSQCWKYSPLSPVTLSLIFSYFSPGGVEIVNTAVHRIFALPSQSLVGARLWICSSRWQGGRVYFPAFIYWSGGIIAAFWLVSFVYISGTWRSLTVIRRWEGSVRAVGPIGGLGSGRVSGGGFLMIKCHRSRSSSSSPHSHHRRQELLCMLSERCYCLQEKVSALTIIVFMIRNIQYHNKQW